MDRDRFKRKTDTGTDRSGGLSPHHIPPTRAHPSHQPVARPPQPTQSQPVPRPHAQHAVSNTLVPAQPVHSKPVNSSVAEPPLPVESLPAGEASMPPKNEAVPQAKDRKSLSKRKIAEIALVAVLLVGGVSYFVFKPGKPEATHATASTSGLHINTKSSAPKSSASVNGTVPFTTVVPADKPQLAKLGTAAYNSQYKSYTFDDTFLGAKVRISEQELPSGQDSAAGLIDKISVSLKAQSVTPITIQSGQPAYLLNATNKAGNQVVVFSVKSILVFIQSSAVHDVAEWPSYLNNFK